MAAAWSMPVEFAPPRVAIVVDKSTWTREIIERNGTFGIVVPGVAAASWTYAVGSVSGRDEDKFNAWGIPVVTGPELGLPLIEEEMSGMDGVRLLPATAAQTPSTTPCSGRWSLPPPMSARSSPDAGNSTTISSIPCIIWHRQFCRQRPSCAGKLPRRISVTCRGRPVFPLPGLRPPFNPVGGGDRRWGSGQTLFYTGW
ncbi:putative enzyme [Klebsiella pneumoniae]|uniref:Putative enzyme n=1 Tax=Klebsiella pneumoniae TaxID=573 RepID=A0A378B408_KLEPN|nr:putative enzyme [Klebsiella pneumoniae]